MQESPTLDLVNDCSRFATGFFEIISASSPHIYHSALASTPRASIVRKLYEPYADPFTRVVHGAAMSWDLNTAATTLPYAIRVAVWSQCNRFIAIARGDTVAVDILDSSTLQRLQTLDSHQKTSALCGALAFSPDGRMLTCSGDGGGPGSGGGSSLELFLVSWDLQTGGIISTIREQGPGQHIAGNPSIAYSRNGKMVCIFYWFHGSAMILTYDVVSGIRMHSHLLGSPFANGDPFSDHGSVSIDIWTHGESLRFVTTGPMTMTIWEIGFASGTTPMEVETLPIPDTVCSTFPSHNDYNDLTERVRFLPVSCRLAIAHEGKVTVWDTRNSKSLLSHADPKCHPRISFSSDGSFFACSTTGTEIHLWKESRTGYRYHKTLTSSTEYSNPLISPNGKLVVAAGGRAIRLWHTKSFPATTSSILTRAPQHFEKIVSFGDRIIRSWYTKSFTTPASGLLTRTPQHTANFVLDFSPDGALAIFARREDNVVTVLDLESGVPQLIINASMGVYGLRVTMTNAVVIGDDKVVAWNLLAGDGVPNGSVGIGDSTWTLNFSGQRQGNVVTASISPDLHHVAFVTFGLPGLRRLYIYSASTGEYIGHSTTNGNTPWFTPDGRGIWCAVSSGEAEVWTIAAYGYPGPSLLVREAPIVDGKHLPEGYPWGSSRGYQTTNYGWVLGPDGKRLLMLAPHWQSYPVRQLWNGRFLALLHDILPGPVILELEA